MGAQRGRLGLVRPRSGTDESTAQLRGRGVVHGPSVQPAGPPGEESGEPLLDRVLFSSGRPRESGAACRTCLQATDAAVRAPLPRPAPTVPGDRMRTGGPVHRAARRGRVPRTGLLDRVHHRVRSRTARPNRS
ncbi:hypothetical protein SSCG_03176 [Streptomyces clavuligerus]|nr:hypothetical protein SSCG_03176 [Streptomyces clavuligerus]